MSPFPLVFRQDLCLQGRHSLIISTKISPILLSHTGKFIMKVLRDASVSKETVCGQKWSLIYNKYINCPQVLNYLTESDF